MRIRFARVQRHGRQEREQMHTLAAVAPTLGAQ